MCCGVVLLVVLWLDLFHRVFAQVLTHSSGKLRHTHHKRHICGKRCNASDRLAFHSDAQDPGTPSEASCCRTSCKASLRFSRSKDCRTSNPTEMLHGCLKLPSRTPCRSRSLCNRHCFASVSVLLGSGRTSLVSFLHTAHACNCNSARKYLISLCASSPCIGGRAAADTRT